MAWALENLPYETLRRRVNHMVSVDCKPGPGTVLTDNEESQLASYFVVMADMGFGLSRDDVMLTAFRIAEKSGRKHPFVKGCAGRSWFDGFKSRHPNLTLRSAQSLSHSRAIAANNEIISDFFWLNLALFVLGLISCVNPCKYTTWTKQESVLCISQGGLLLKLGGVMFGPLHLQRRGRHIQYCMWISCRVLSSAIHDLPQKEDDCKVTGRCLSWYSLSV